MKNSIQGVLESYMIDSVTEGISIETLARKFPNIFKKTSARLDREESYQKNMSDAEIASRFAKGLKKTRIKIYSPNTDSNTKIASDLTIDVCKAKKLKYKWYGDILWIQGVDGKEDTFTCWAKLSADYDHKCISDHRSRLIKTFAKEDK